MKSINSDDIKIIKNMKLSGDEIYVLENFVKPLIYGLNPKKIKDTLSINLADIWFIDIDGEHPKFAYLEAGPPNRDKDTNFTVYNYSDKIYNYPIIYPTNELALKVAKWLTLQCLFVKGLIRYPTYSNNLFDYFCIEVYDTNSTWKGVQKYQIRCKNDDEICYRFAADTEKDLFTLTESEVDCVSDFLNNPESPLHSYVKQKCYFGDIDELKKRLGNITTNWSGTNGAHHYWPITMKQIVDYIDIVGLDKDSSHTIQFITEEGFTIDIFTVRRRSNDSIASIINDTMLYPDSEYALRIVKFVLLIHLQDKGIISIPKGLTSHNIEEFWTVDIENDRIGSNYYVKRKHSDEKYKLQIQPDISILGWVPIKIVNSLDDCCTTPEKLEEDIKCSKDYCGLLTDSFITDGKTVYYNGTAVCNVDGSDVDKEEGGNKMFNHKFGKVRGNVLALSYDGKIAVKKSGSDDYVRYNTETSTVENIKDFVINDSKWFFMIPAAEVEVGDIIKYNDGFYQVIKVNEENISAINLMNSTMTTIVKETIFGMSCYAKVISLIDKDTFGTLDNSGNMMMFMMMMEDDDNMDMKELMMMQMFTNKDEKQNINPMILALMMDDNDDDMLTNIMMLQMMTGGNAQFDMSNMMQNPMMFMMLMKDKGNGRGEDNKLFKMMMLMNLMNQHKTETKDDE